ncbi:hypothetical protein SLNWT_6738 [Streptomyces albus]|uniref:Uncharacterized protein n=1 Tax=Streptomyces albus (strain ATCC 21838 / DSM 41398 / FERM P-419 / JCM 4703 / NBRC 107858) TaxID=1081613 RepID=A0A0B5EZ83_STRA4|nr:hypothetical protein SLNWT_6738 [Streptomyces albus]AOU81419.1 hypothetical protein SLNHY_6728 [Streptomyces albus]AYN37113.1 hypothetical protein DUI70_6619 [Streptomyces albus]
MGRVGHHASVARIRRTSMGGAAADVESAGSIAGHPPDRVSDGCRQCP